MNECKFAIKMLQNKCKITYNICTRIKHMNCIVAVIIAILALVIHVANNFSEEKTKILPKDVFQMTVDKTET